MFLSAAHKRKMTFAGALIGACLALGCQNSEEDPAPEKDEPYQNSSFGSDAYNRGNFPGQQQFPPNFGSNTVQGSNPIDQQNPTVTPTPLPAGNFQGCQGFAIESRMQGSQSATRCESSVATGACQNINKQELANPTYYATRGQLTTNLLLKLGTDVPYIDVQVIKLQYSNDPVSCAPGNPLVAFQFGNSGCYRDSPVSLPITRVVMTGLQRNINGEAIIPLNQVLADGAINSLSDYSNSYIRFRATPYAQDGNPSQVTCNNVQSASPF